MRADSKDLPLRHDSDTSATSTANIVDRVTDGFVALDTNWRYTYVNRQAAFLFGRQPEDLIGKHIWTEFPDGIGQPFHLAYEKAFAEQVFIQIESFYEPWQRWFENRIHPSPEGVSIFFHEITARKQAEQVAEQNAELLKGQNAVLELISSGAPLRETLDVLLRLIETHCPGVLGSIVLLDDDGVHVRHGAAPSLPDSFVRAVDGQPIGPRAGSCGTAAFRHEPVIVEDIAADPLWIDYRELALTHGLRACWSTPILDATGDVLGTFALYFRKPTVPTAWHRQLIELTTHTAAIALVKQRSEAELSRRQTQLAEAQRIAQLGSYEWDIAANRVYRSEELCRIFGLAPADFPPTFEGYLERVHPDDRSTTRSIVEQAWHDAIPFDFEERIVRPDGTIRRLHSQGKWVLGSDQRPVTLIGICHDITEQKQAEELRQRSEELEHEIAHRKRAEQLLRARNEELNAFAYTVSHDLKAPLRGIAGYAQELDRRHRQGLGDRALFCLDQILAATRNLDQLIEDLLHYARLDAETSTNTDVDLGAVVQALLNERRPVIIEQAAEVTVNLAAGTIHTWERGIGQVVTNLIDNALKYSRHARPPMIRIASEKVDDTWRISVADNGVGFDMKYHDRIFGLFNRLVREEEFEGTGAGLAIVKKLVGKLGGRIRAESESGKGATFVVELPAAPAAEAGEPR